MKTKINLFEIMQFCFVHLILLFAYLSVLLKSHFLKSDQYSWVFSCMALLATNVKTVVHYNVQFGFTCSNLKLGNECEETSSKHPSTPRLHPPKTHKIKT